MISAHVTVTKLPNKTKMLTQLHYLWTNGYCSLSALADIKHGHTCTQNTLTCTIKYQNKKEFFWAVEMAQWLRALTAPEVLSSIPSNHMVAHNHL